MRFDLKCPNVQIGLSADVSHETARWGIRNPASPSISTSTYTMKMQDEAARVRDRITTLTPVAFLEKKAEKVER
jgi:hypothetical protein